MDPPWSYQNKSGRHAPDYGKDNRVMTLDQVVSFDVQRWVPEDACHLYLWVTDAYVGGVGRILEAWGFAPKATLVWVKDRIGMGNYFRHQHELCVFATSGPAEAGAHGRLNGLQGAGEEAQREAGRVLLAGGVVLPAALSGRVRAQEKARMGRIRR